jgi:O-antigen/teichoic acid export membrane protein
MPKRTFAAYALVRLSVVTSIAVAALVGLLLALFHRQMLQLFHLGIIASNLWLIPIGGCCAGLVQTYEQWHIRRGHFGVIPKSTIVQAVFVSGSRVAAGFATPSAAALVLVGAIGSALNALLLYLPARADRQGPLHPFAHTKATATRAMFGAARRYRDFPLYRAPQALLSTVSRSLPSLLFAALFGPTIAGYYAIAQSVLYLPVSLVAISVGKVLLPRIAAQAHGGDTLRPFILRATMGLALLAAVPFGCAIVFGPTLFMRVFGAQWREAGVFARWLAVWMFFHFINVPAVQSLTFTTSNRLLLVWQVATTTSNVALVVGVGLETHNAQATIAAYAVWGALAYAYLISVGLARAGTPTYIPPPKGRLA